MPKLVNSFQTLPGQKSAAFTLSSTRSRRHPSLRTHSNRW